MWDSFQRSIFCEFPTFDCFQEFITTSIRNFFFISFGIFFCTNWMMILFFLQGLLPLRLNSRLWSFARWNECKKIQTRVCNCVTWAKVNILAKTCDFDRSDLTLRSSLFWEIFWKFLEFFIFALFISLIRKELCSKLTIHVKKIVQKC